MHSTPSLPHSVAQVADASAAEAAAAVAAAPTSRGAFHHGGRCHRSAANLGGVAADVHALSISSGRLIASEGGVGVATRVMTSIALP